MKKWIILLLALGILPPLSAAKKRKQERFETGHFIRLEAGAGICDLNYTLQGGNTVIQPSWSLQADYVYFFNKWLGLGTGIHFTRYATRANLTDDMVWTGLTDYAGDTYDHHLRFSGWRERQRLFQMEIPLAVHFKYKPRKTGFFSAVGLKLGIPLQNEWSHYQGEQTHSAYYPFWDVWMQNLPGRYGTETLVYPQEGKTDAMTRVNCVGYIEAGMLFEVTRRTDITLSLYAQYNFNNALRTDLSERTPLGFATPENGYGSFMNAYAGLIGTDHVGILHPWTVGLKVGASVTPRLTEREKMRKARKLARKWKDYLPQKDTVILTRTDTLVRTDTLHTILRDTVYLPQECPPARTDTVVVMLTPEQRQLDEMLSKSVIWFRFDESVPILEPSYIIDSVAVMLRNHPDLRIAVNGHACIIGSDRYNAVLARKRAEAVAALLRKKGVNGQQMTIASFGADVPFRYNGVHTLEKDRRVEIIPLIDAATSRTVLLQDYMLPPEDDATVVHTGSND